MERHLLTLNAKLAAHECVMIAHNSHCNKALTSQIQQEREQWTWWKHISHLSLCSTVWLHNWPCATGNTFNQQRFATEVSLISEASEVYEAWTDRPADLPSSSSFTWKPFFGLQWSPLPLGLCNVPEYHSHNYKQLATFTWMDGWAVTSSFSWPARGQVLQKPVLLVKLSTYDIFLYWDCSWITVTQSSSCSMLV